MWWQQVCEKPYLVCHQNSPCYSQSDQSNPWNNLIIINCRSTDFVNCEQYNNINFCVHNNIFISTLQLLSIGLVCFSLQKSFSLFPQVTPCLTVAWKLYLHHLGMNMAPTISTRRRWSHTHPWLERVGAHESEDTVTGERGRPLQLHLPGCCWSHAHLVTRTKTMKRSLLGMLPKEITENEKLRSLMEIGISQDYLGFWPHSH